MAFPIPDATKITPAVDMQTLMGELYTHFNSTSTKWQIDGGSTVNGTPTGSDGFTITAQGIETFQINFRRKDTDECYVMIDPNASITDSGDTSTAPTGPSTMASLELTSLRSLTSGNTVMIVEWDDAIMVLVENNTNAYYQYGMAAGKHHQPFFDDDPSRGLDGLLVFGQVPQFAAASDWGNTNGASTYSQVRVADTGVAANDWLQSFYASRKEAIRSGDGRLPNSEYYPTPYVMMTGTSISYGRMLGFSKYLFRTEIQRLAKSRLQDNAGVEKFMHVHSTSGSSPMVIPWPDNTPP